MSMVYDAKTETFRGGCDCPPLWHQPGRSECYDPTIWYSIKDMHEPPPYPADKIDWSSLPDEEDDK